MPSVLEKELKISELGPLPLLKIPLFASYLVPADDKQDKTITGASVLKANLSNIGPQNTTKHEAPRSCFGASLQSLRTKLIMHPSIKVTGL